MSITTMEYKIVLNNADCGVIISEHLTSGVVLKLFPPAKSKIYQDWTIVCWHNEAGYCLIGLREGKERL